MIGGDAVLEAVRSAGVLRDVAAHGAGGLARGIGHVVEPVRQRPPRRAGRSRRRAGPPRAGGPGSTSRIRFIRVRATRTASGSATAPPESPVPAPRATNGIAGEVQQAHDLPDLGRGSPACTTTPGIRLAGREGRPWCRSRARRAGGAPIAGRRCRPSAAIRSGVMTRRTRRAGRATAAVGVRPPVDPERRLDAAGEDRDEQEERLDPPRRRALRPGAAASRPGRSRARRRRGTRARAHRPAGCGLLGLDIVELAQQRGVAAEQLPQTGRQARRPAWVPASSSKVSHHGHMVRRGPRPPAPSGRSVHRRSTMMLERPSGSSWLTRTSAMQPTVPGVGQSRRRFARRRDPEAPISREAVGQHLPVAWLEDVERERRAGEEDDGEGEDGQPEGHGWESRRYHSAAPQAVRRYARPHRHDAGRYATSSRTSSRRSGGQKTSEGSPRRSSVTVREDPSRRSG